MGFVTKTIGKGKKWGLEVRKMAEQWARAEQIAKLFKLSVRRIQQLTQEGIIHSEKVSGQKGRMYDLIPTIQEYVGYLQDKANGKARSDKELDLKEQKLKAEIALKESQGELHRLKTEIATGKYISVEEVQIDYQKFFIILKKFVLAVPNRVGGLLTGYVDPIVIRSLENDMTKECTEMLNTFVVAAKTAKKDGEKD